MAKRPLKNAATKPGLPIEQEARAQELALLGARITKATGTNDADLQRRLLNQALGVIRLPADEDRGGAIAATLAALEGIAPADGIEGLLATQMVASHEAAVECLRRAMIPDENVEKRDLFLKQSAKLLQIYMRQVEALDKHRGRGQQKITVEHVTVQAGGQAIVGNVQAP